MAPDHDDTDEPTRDAGRPVARTRRAYERIADDYRERNAAVDPVEGLLERFRGALPDHPRVLDAGCGHGRDAGWLAARDCRVLGLDFAAAQLASAREVAPAAALVRGDLRTIPVADRAVDGVLAMASLLHLPRGDLSGALSELRRVLRPGGVLAVSVRRSLGEGVTEGFGREGRYFVAHAPAALRDRLTDAGLAVETIDPDEDWVWALARRPR